MTEAMTSREIVAATLDYTGPERVARSFSPSDFASVHTTVPTHATEWQKVRSSGVQTSEEWTRTDEGGNVWSRIDPTSKGGEGGFVAGYCDNASIGLEPTWQDHASATFVTYGLRSRYR